MFNYYQCLIQGVSCFIIMTVSYSEYWFQRGRSPLIFTIDRTTGDTTKHLAEYFIQSGINIALRDDVSRLIILYGTTGVDIEYSKG